MMKSTLIRLSLAALLLGACAPDSPAPLGSVDATNSTDASHPDPPEFVPTTADRLEVGPYAVGTTTLTFVDSTRPTPPNGDIPASEHRTLVTEVWYPRVADGTDSETRDAAGLRAEGPYPRIVHSHGFMSSRLDSSGLGAFLASHGYVVAAPDFPLTHRLAPGGPNVVDAAAQPQDVRFIADALLDESAGEGVLSGLMNDAGLGFVGVSLGAYTTVMASLDPLLAGPKPNAAVSIATAACFLEPRIFETTVPTLMIHGDRDAVLPYALHAQPVFEQMNRPKWLMALHKGTHTGCVDITSGLMSDLDHADVIGCEALTRTLPTEEEGDWPVSEGMDYMEEACEVPCSDTSLLTDGMNTLRQRDLIFAAVLAFLDGQIRSDEDAMAFINFGVSDENSDVMLHHLP
jgi:predicted dienelactone hydrolase